MTASALLPDPFRLASGSPVASAADWARRREEIRHLAGQCLYGPLPAAPVSVTGTVTPGAITVRVSGNGTTAELSAGLQLPAGNGPFPAVIALRGTGADAAVLLSCGAAVITFDPRQAGQENTGRAQKAGAFYDLFGAASSAGLLTAWSWGVSRIIDVIAQSASGQSASGQGGGSILRDAIGVTGCSRFGKGALVAGAFDERIALTMPVESGTGGVPAFRGAASEPGAQPPEHAFAEQPWLGDTFGEFAGDPATLPLDTHEIIGLIAPRGLLVLDNPHIDWLAARSGCVAALAGAEVYGALGARQNISYLSDVQDAAHCAARPEWAAPLRQSIRAFLHSDGTGPGEFRISPRKHASLSQWRDWSTPALSRSTRSPCDPC